ncbi:MAG: hypothetical protein OXG35_30350, partial [Acidobacteria bacterium]|nr:hypothetical protein [Acidobacteriota bacterium]
LAAAGALVLCAVLQSVSGAMTLAKMLPEIERVMALVETPFAEFPVQGLAVVGGLLGYPMFYGVMLLAVLAIDILVSGSEQPRLLAKFTAVSFYTQVPWCIVMIAIAWYWTPEPMRVPVGASETEILEAAARYQRSIQSEPLMSTGRLLGHFSSLWLSAMLAIALKVVGSLSVRATVAVGTVLFVICMAGPIFNFVLESLR